MFGDVELVAAWMNRFMEVAETWEQFGDAEN